MLIAQITDLHLGFDRDNPAENNQQRLDQVLDKLAHGPNRPDLVIASGDLTEFGDEESYDRLAGVFARAPFLIYPALGNHDDRAAFARHFPQAPFADGFLQYAIDLGSLRIIILDTLEPGRHGGAFCAKRAAWLRAQLESQHTVPTLIVMHHPPFAAGIAWMDTHVDEPWVAHFEAAIAGHDQIRAIICGHVHRAIVTPWRGLTAVICPSTAPSVALDLRPIDADKPDDRAMIIGDPPGYALHRWTGDAFVTLFDTVAIEPTLARFNAAMQPLVKMLADEKPR